MKSFHIVKIRDRRWVNGLEMGHPISIPERDAWIGTFIESGRYKFWRKEGYFMEYMVPLDLEIGQEIHVARAGFKERVIWNVVDFDDNFLLLKTKELFELHKGAL